MPQLFFYLFAGIALAFSLGVIFRKNPVSAALSLVMVFFSFAAIYALSGAHLVATLQVLVYAGAIMVLFIFVIMLLNADVPSLDVARTSVGVKLGSVGLSAAALAVLVWGFRTSGITGARAGYSIDAIAQAGGNTRVISQQMFSTYLLPFELTSVLLLAGIVGSVALAKRKQTVVRDERREVQR